MDYTELISAIFKVVIIILSMFVIPWIKKKISADDLAKIMTYVEIFVAAAEQIFDVSQWEEKKAYVLQRLEEKNFKIDAEALDALIEAEVLRLHAELKAIANSEPAITEPAETEPQE